jgi:hypothetical protein
MSLGEEGKRMVVHDVQTGRPVWAKDIAYTDPPILHGDRIIAGGKAIELLTGNPVMREDPLTGKQVAWSYTRAYGCNYPIACENLLTFRSSAAGFFDLANDGGVGNFGGFKSSCSSNLIAADGLLNAPDYTRTCSCSFQNQTSLAFVHMPELEMWTRNDFQYRGGVIERIGVNFGAAGDRRASDSTLWLEFPSRGAPSPKAPIEVSGEAKYFQRNPAAFLDGETPWVASSGLEGDVSVRITLDTKFDPTLAEGIPVGTNADDAEEDKDGKVRLDSTDLELVTDKDPQTVGIRFSGVDVGPGYRLEEAFIQFSVDEKTTDKTELLIRGEDIDNASVFTTDKNNISKRAKTTARVEWKPEPWVNADEHTKTERTPDLAPILSAILARPGWKSGNSVAFIFTGKGQRTARSFDGKAGGAPRLVLRVAGQPSPIIGSTANTARYKVRLHFAEPEDVAAGARVFDVFVQGQKVLDDFDIIVAAGGARRGVVREFSGIPVNGALNVQLKAVTTRQPILCGVEAIAQGADDKSDGKTDDK